MSTTTARSELGGRLVFRTPAGESIAAQGVEVAVVAVDDAIDELRLIFEVPPDTYRTIATAGLFHLAPDNRGPGSDLFAPGSEVRIEARLDADAHTEIELLGAFPEAVGRTLLELSAGGKWSPLLETESWYALHVTTLVPQDIDEEGELREGYSTIFAARGGDEGSEPQTISLRLPLLAVALGAMEERGIEWSETGDDEIVQCEIAGENGEWTCYVVAREADSRCTVYSQPEWYAPEEQRMAMAELLTRINYGLTLGNFEMDMADGEIRFKTSVSVKGDRLSADLFETLMDSNFAAIDAYLPALEAVRDGGLTPEDAIQLVEE